MNVNASKPRGDLNDGLASAQSEPSASKGTEARCPTCGSKRLFRDGWRKLADGSRVQRYICRDCGHRFTDPSYRRGKTHETSGLNRSNGYVKDEGHEDLVDGSETGTVALMEKPLLSVKGPAGGTENTEQGENLLTGFALWLLKNGRKGSTVDKNVRIIKMLRKITNIYDPEAVKESITKMGISCLLYTSDAADE